MKWGVSLSRQVAKAVRDVPHDPECLKGTIDDRFHCTCPDREERLVAAITAAFRMGASWALARRSNPEIWDRMLAAFRRAAIKPTERSIT